MFSDNITKAIAEAAKTVMDTNNEAYPDAASTSIYADKPGDAPISDMEIGMDREMTDEEMHDEEMTDEGMISDEEIQEALKKSQPASEWINDFVNSKDAKFKDKSKGERINMALGAYYAAQNESVSEGVEEPRSQGEKNFKAAHTIVKMADPNADRQTGTEAMDQKAKPVLPIGKSFSKAEDIDGEKYNDKDFADIKASGKRATAPKASAPGKFTYADGCDVYNKTAAAINKSAQGAASAPKASGSKQSGAQSIEKVSNTAPSGKLSAEYPKANQKRPDAMPKGLKETALANLLGEEKMTNFDKQFADDNEKALKQILAGQGTDGIECHGQPKQKVLVQLNKYIDSYGDELKKYFGLPIQDKVVNEAAEMSDEDRDDKVSAIFKRFGIQDTNYEQDLDKAIEDLSKKSRIAAAQVKSLLKDSVEEAFSKTVTTREEGAILLKVADMMNKIGSYRNLHKSKGPNGNATEIFAEFVKDGEQVARVMVNNSYNDNEVEVSVEVTAQPWSSRSSKSYDNAQIKKEFKIDDSNLIKFLKNPIQGKSNDEVDSYEEASDATPEFQGTGATRASDWADACEDAAKRVAGLVNRDKDTPLQYRLTSKLKAAYNMLADVAEKLDNESNESEE